MGYNQLNYADLKGSCHILEGAINHPGPRPISEASHHRGLWMIHSVISESVNFCAPLGDTWSFPPEPEHMIIHLTLCFMGFSLWIKVVAVTLMWASKFLLLSPGPWVVISFCYLILYFCTSSPNFFCKYIVNQMKRFQSRP